MARVRATCDDCGDVELPIQGVSVRVCRDDQEGTYEFSCPTCSTHHVKSASRRTLDLLIASGTEVTFWSVPVERIVESGLGALTHDDLLDFHRRIQDDNAIEIALGELVDDRA